MTMPHERMQAFLWAGEILWDIVKTTEHTKKWGAALPKGLVDKARITLHYYPSSLELEWAADDQRTMHTWMARAPRGREHHKDFYARLEAVVAQVRAKSMPGDMPFDGEAFLIEWLSIEHPALGYREPEDILNISGSPESLVRLFKAEVFVLREAWRVLKSEARAYLWLRSANPSLGAIPLEMLGTETGHCKVVAELVRMAGG